MGNDGGSIPTRRELVREAARAPSTQQIKEAQREQQEHFWTTCPISHKPLQRPIVSDCIGNLYNKDAILKFLLPGDEAEDISSKADCEAILCGRVKGLRDVVELKFEVDTEREQHPSSKLEKREGWICPITAKPLGPNVKSVYLVPCGHVFSEEAVRQVKEDKCLQCNEPFTDDNIVPILSAKETDKQQLMARAQRLSEQGLAHSLKKAPGSKKRKKHANGDSSEATESKSKDQATAAPTASTSNGIKNSATATLTARILEEENEKKKRRKMMAGNENLDSLFSKKKEGASKGGDFMTRGFTYTQPAAAKK